MWPPTKDDEVAKWQGLKSINQGRRLRLWAKDRVCQWRCAAGSILCRGCRAPWLQKEGGCLLVGGVVKNNCQLGYFYMKMLYGLAMGCETRSMIAGAKTLKIVVWRRRSIPKPSDPPLLWGGAWLACSLAGINWTYLARCCQTRTELVASQELECSCNMKGLKVIFNLQMKWIADDWRKKCFVQRWNH